MIFRQLFDATSSTYTYLLGDDRTRQAVLVDPVFEQHARDTALLRELELELVVTLDTHCHADHVTGAWLMKRVLGSKTGLSPLYGAKNIDVELVHGAKIQFGDRALEVRAVPGHTSGCVALVLDGHSMVMTGDALLIRGAGRTDFQGGSAHTLYRSIHEQLFSLPDACLLYPGHDYEGRTASTIGEEKVHNPRIGGGAREEDFVGTMHNLGLPHPKQLAISLPANLRGGAPENDAVPPQVDWAPVVVTYAGLCEIAPEWVAMHRDEVQILDVRSRAEAEGELGRLTDARILPLDELRDHVGELSDARPIIAVCQTGKRSGMATLILRNAGLHRVANLAGGMVRWRDLGLPN